MGFLKVIYDECENQLEILKKESPNLKKLLMSLSEFRGIMKFLPLDKVYRFHVSRINFNDLKKYINKIQRFAKEKSIDIIVVTEKSARIVGEILDGMKVNKKIIYFVPDILTREKVKNPDFFFKRDFKEILLRGKRILILDEYILTGNTLKKIKNFFMNLGSKKVYTATMYKDEKCKFKPDFFIKKTFLAPPWYDFPIMLREKVEGSFKTEPLTIKSRILKKRLFEEKEKLIKKLLRNIK